MNKEFKKIIWYVIYGISLVSFVTGFFTLLVNLLSFCAYGEFCIAGIGTVLGGSSLREIPPSFVSFLCGCNAFPPDTVR